MLNMCHGCYRTSSDSVYACLKLHFVNESFFSSETTWNNFQNTLTNRNTQIFVLVSNLFFAVEEVGACRELSFARQGSQVSRFLVAFESLQLESRGNSSFSRGISCCFHCITIEYRLMLRYKSSLWGCFDPWEWSSHVSRMCFHVETLDQIRAPAKRAVEKFPVSQFHLEMAASSTESSTQSSTHSDELESQESLLGEGDETPRFCSVYLRGTTGRCVLGFIILWLSGMFVTIFVLKLNWHIVLRCLPGCIFGFILVLMASYDMKNRESKHIETEKLPTWAVLALLHFLWLVFLSVFEMTWQGFALEVVGTALGCLGLCGWMAEADDSEEDDMHNKWRFAGWMLQMSGLLVIWLGALPCLVQITLQAAVCSLPGICWCLLAFDACREGVARDIDEDNFIVISLSLLNFMALPLSGMWQSFTGMELAAFSYLCIVLCNWIWFAYSSGLESLEKMNMKRILVGFGVVICALHFGAFALTTKLSCNLVGPWCHCWPWVLFVPFGLVCIYCAIEGVLLLWYRHKVRATRAAMLTRIIIIGTLALAPVLLATDVETWQEGVEAPSMNPMEYFAVSMKNWTHPDIEVKRHQLHWLQMPQPIWPSSDDLANSSSRRTAFWLSYMFFKFLFAAAMAFLVLKCNCASSNQSRDGEDSQSVMELEEAQRESFDDCHRSTIFCAILPIYLTLVIKVSCTAALFGQLTAKTGLAFEGYDLCLTCGLLWLVVQALALRASDFKAQYDAADVVLSMSFLVPFIGDGFDSLKDAMLGALALRSQLVPLQFLGLASLAYLVTFHVVLVCNGSDRVQLEKAYMPILFLKKQQPRSNTAQGAGRYQKVLVLMYEQVKPSRQWAMLLEDLPQGMVALVVSSVEGFQGFTVIVNIGVPLFRISMAWLLHDWIASQLADWFLEEALKASDAKQFALCDDFIAALHRLQSTSSFKASDLTLWQHLRKKNEKCCSEAVQKSQDDQSPVSLRLFVALQRVGIDNESAEDGWKKIYQLLKQCTPRQILDATRSIACAASSLSELVLPGGLGLTKVMTILESIREPQRLTNLEVHLGGEKMGFSGAQALGQALVKFQHITTLTLYLHDNNLGQEAARALADHLSDLAHLTEVTVHLSIDDNEFEDEIEERLQRPGRTVKVGWWLAGGSGRYDWVWQWVNVEWWSRERHAVFSFTVSAPRYAWHVSFQPTCPKIGWTIACQEWKNSTVSLKLNMSFSWNETTFFLMPTFKHLHCTYFIAIFLLFHIMFHHPEYCCKWQVTRRKEFRLPCCRVSFREEKVRVALLLCTWNHLSAFRKIWNHLPGEGRKAGADDHGDQQGEHSYVTQRGWKCEGCDMRVGCFWMLLVICDLNHWENDQSKC